MAAFFAYFDLLGYKKFIENNSDVWLDKRTDDFGRNVEMALSLDHPYVASRHPGNVISDLSHSTLNCLTFSDTVLLWTSNSTLQDFEELLRVCFKYNYFNNCFDFPGRGRIEYGEISFKQFDNENQRGGRYFLNMIYGKVLITTYQRAEAMSWAGCVLDSSAIEFAKTLGNIDALLEEHTMLYDVPYKTREGEEITQKEYALRLVKGRVLITKHMEEGIERAFTQDNKGNIAGRTKVIFDNTIEFLRAHRIKFPYFYHLDNSEGGSSKQIFGRLDEDYTHTTITMRKITDAPAVYNVDTVKFDPDRSDRDFLVANEIASEIFEQQHGLAVQ